MDPLTQKIVARLYRSRNQFSRNGNFQAYQDTRVKRAAKLCKHLWNLQEDLLAHGTTDTVYFEPMPEEGGAQIRLRIEALECRRTAFISLFELSLLRENADLAPLLSPVRAAS